MPAHWKSRRLAARALKVYSRHSDKPEIAAYERSLPVLSAAYITAYDAAGRHESTWRREMLEGRGAMAALLRDLGAWKPHIAREKPELDLTTIGDRPTVPEDLTSDALALAEALDAVRDPDGNTPTWAAGAAAKLRESTKRAEDETDEAAAADAQHNELLAAVRKAKAPFEAELSRFRATLEAVLGRSHPDFQKLRAKKVSTPDPEDDPAAPSAAPPVVAAEEPA
ncbi:MAG: hypothetical protein H5U40_15185 [Polyangiaceae bacterium]|nr:hypothetical protein [Polyangiaceae bacterium]